MRSSLMLGLLLVGLVGCSAKRDYSAFYSHAPRSILVMPALNETSTVDAEAIYQTTFTRPIAERGYYVYPVVLTEALLRDLGVADPGLAHQMPVDRVREVFGADAVLFVTIKDWSHKYIVLQSSNVVELHFVLKDTRTGTVLWEQTQSAVQSSGNGGGGLIGMAVQAAVTYAVNELIDYDYRPLAVQANQTAFATAGTGLPAGPYLPDYGKDHDRY